MGLSASQRFLVEATRAAGAGDFFRWRGVGDTLGYSDAQAGEAVQSLGERRLLVLFADGQARLLAAGRELAERLNNKFGAGDEPVKKRSKSAGRAR
jgi:hypothetical protein